MIDRLDLTAEPPFAFADLSVLPPRFIKIVKYLPTYPPTYLPTYQHTYLANVLTANRLLCLTVPTPPPQPPRLLFFLPSPPPPPQQRSIIFYSSVVISTILKRSLTLLLFGRVYLHRRLRFINIFYFICFFHQLIVYIVVFLHCV